jgi:hypothetical protein
MRISDALDLAKYVVGPDGNKTDVLIPLETWKELLVTWQHLVDLLEDQEDRAIFNEWLEKRATGEAQTISLEELEQELGEDGSLPG